MKNLLFALLALAFAPISNGADVKNQDYWYVGGGLSAVRIGEICNGATGATCDDTGLGISLRGGWRLNRGFALEGMIDFGSGFVSPAARAANLNGDTNVMMLGVGAIGFIPLGPRVSIFGGASAVYSEASTKIYAEGTGPRDCSYHYSHWTDEWSSYCTSHNNDEYTSGGSMSLGGQLGVEVRAGRRVYLRARAQRYFGIDGGLSFGARRDVDLFGVQVLIAF